MKRIYIVLLVAITTVSAFGAAANHVPELGTWSLGFTFNPASLGSQIKVQPKAGEFAGDFITTTALNPNQMFMLSQDPIAALRAKCLIKEHLNFRMSIGFSGSHINYSEYVKDDLAALAEATSEAKVVDQVRSEMNSTNIAVGVEYTMGKGNLHFVAGFNLLYAFAGGKLTCQYGNEMTIENPVPSAITMLANPSASSLNEWKAAQGITYARPTERYTKGFNHGLGFQVDAGVEWFFMDHLSLGANVTFTPIMAVMQPQTYAKYEGMSTLSYQKENFTSLISPGSWMLLYGTQNLGFQVSMNYYF